MLIKGDLGGDWQGGLPCFLQAFERWAVCLADSLQQEIGKVSVTGPAQLKRWLFGKGIDGPKCHTHMAAPLKAG